MNNGGNLITSPKRVELAEERIRKPSQVLRELLLRQPVPIFSENSSRSGEEVSPKQEDVMALLFLFLSSRLGEKSSPENVWVLFPSLSLGVPTCLVGLLC